MVWFVNPHIRATWQPDYGKATPVLVTDRLADRDSFGASGWTHKGMALIEIGPTDGMAQRLADRRNSLVRGTAFSRAQMPVRWSRCWATWA